MTEYSEPGLSWFKEALLLSRFELRKLTRERFLVSLATILTIAPAPALGLLAVEARAPEQYVFAWNLLASLGAVFGAVSITTQSLLADHDRGTLVPLLATPISDLALITGRALPVVGAGIAFGLSADSLFVVFARFGNPALVVRMWQEFVVQVPGAVIAASGLIGAVMALVDSRIASSRAAGLVVTFSAFGILMAEFEIAVALASVGGAGARSTFDMVVTQLALAIALTAIAASSFRRDRLIGGRFE